MEDATTDCAAFDEAVVFLSHFKELKDPRQQGKVTYPLDEILLHRTAIVIAHRLSTIHRADQILVVEEGRIVERGTHDSLYAARGRYYDLSSRQQTGNLLIAPGELPGMAAHGSA